MVLILRETLKNKNTFLQSNIFAFQQRCPSVKIHHQHQRLMLKAKRLLLERRESQVQGDQKVCDKVLFARLEEDQKG